MCLLETAVGRCRGTVPGFLFVGFSWQHLWWSDPGDSRGSRRKVIVSGDQRPEDHCLTWGMIAFMP
jgi:hypothetical protein